ncbi:mannose-6-phosphate isomerase [Paenarthrobacter nicotinovorans]|uniref:mannose-6-phosphate isomerase, class I n=1 Tax=Micrococcaceae TaxID=1268 RepID=UPI0008768793|nr:MULTISPECIES: mannose-6-phosphate isomerase, class I [Micrococcaceae]MDR6436585.1 mannose-6-phosphate isomerase [Paenarthrobacter nicotinovorans]SCZ57236.1 mannose-6-phosphate isomerase, type 1 [Arthrobacter sp. UNCCL28]
MHLLTGARRSYDWGSTTSMTEFLGTDSDGKPFAELWLGAHPTGPSTITGPAGTEDLDDWVARDRLGNLGHSVDTSFGRLPFLVKLLAPAKPLSIQVHPTRELAAKGYLEEERQGIPLDDPRRTFKDTNNKPEMVYAISHFEGLAGFRPRQEIALFLGEIAGPLEPAQDRLNAPGEQGMKLMLETLVGLSPEDIRTVLEIAASLALDHRHPAVREACATVCELATAYSGDVGAIVSLVLNRVRLAPGESMFLADGVPHAYLAGFGLEVMANSDNVLRLGLTSKHIDIQAMLGAVDFSSSGVDITSGPINAATHIFRPPVPDFALSITRPERSGEGCVTLPGSGPRILVCLEGNVRVQTQVSADTPTITRGQSVFVPANEGGIRVEGAGTIAQAFVP